MSFNHSAAPSRVPLSREDSLAAKADASAKAGDVEKSRKAYEEFLKLWKDADGELSPLTEARREYDRLMQALH